MIDSNNIFSSLPEGLRKPLIESYQAITTNYIERRWEPSELNGGKFSEIVYTILDSVLTGTVATKPSKPSNMLVACRDPEKLSADPRRVGDRSLRILIPRVLVALYEIRNNRGVGHAGGDVDPNLLDATTVQAMASWILAELVRIFHNTSTDEAQKTVDELVERKHPLIWEPDEGLSRVLDPKMKKADQALILLHQKSGWVSEADLMKWVEYSSLPMFRKRVLLPAHNERWVEYDQKNGRVRISPIGIERAEKELLGSRV